MSSSGDPPASMTLVIGIIGGILLLALILLTQVLFYNIQRMEDAAKLYAGKPQELADLQSGQLAQINTYRYVDPQRGVVAIPIDRAIELYAREQTSAPAPATIPSSAPADAPEGEPVP